MARQNWCMIVGLALLAIGGGWQSTFGDETSPAVANATQTVVEEAAAKPEQDKADVEKANEKAKKTTDRKPAEAKDAVDLFGGVNDGKLDMTFVARSAKEARVIITNKTKQPMTIRLPEAFAGVPVLAQRQGGGGGGFGGGGNQFGGGGGVNQSIGGGFGGGGLGGGGFGGGGGGFGGGGGGGGFFNIAPEQTARLEVAVVCLDHGLRDPSSSKQYQMVPIESHVKRPAVVELIKAFGRGELQHGAAQAAAWNLNNDLPWEALASKLQGTERSLTRSSYFSRQEIQAAMAYAGEASRRGQLAEMQRINDGGTSLISGSEAISTAADPAPKSASEADSKADAKVDAENSGTKQRSRRTRPASPRTSEKSQAKEGVATQP